MNVIDKLASRWLDYRTGQIAKGIPPNSEGVTLHKVSYENGELQMVLLAPNVFLLAEEAAALLSAQSAKNFLQIDLLPRMDRAVKPIRLTIQWMDGMSPAAKCAKLERELNALIAEKRRS